MTDDKSRSVSTFQICRAAFTYDHSSLGNARENYGDTFTDFAAGAGSDDVIENQDSLFADFAAVRAASQRAGSNVVIPQDASSIITLQNVTLANLRQNDFHLA